jgi:3-deoxy-D-manno-octulosonic-acid transferase
MAYVDAARLLPIDAPLCVRRALSSVGYQRLVIGETELWPTLLREVQSAGRPVHIINGRVSDYTFRWYRLFHKLFAPLLRRCVSISVPDEEQRERFLALGAEPNSLHVTGHTKYDSIPRFAGTDARERARQKFFPGIDTVTPIVVLGSLREGEELAWFSALQQGWQAGLQFRVVVAPRHAEKFEFFWGALARLDCKVVRWSFGAAFLGGDHQVVLLDTMGLLEEAYAASDLAFIGATLVDIGGHNPLEPAMYRVPVVVGPYTSVIRATVSRLREEGGIIEVRDAEEIVAVLQRLGAVDPTLQQVAQAGYNVYASYAGATKRVLEVIRVSEVQRSAVQ